MIGLFRLRRTITFGTAESRLFDQDTFYKTFLRDLHYCRSEVVIESPFITRKRMLELLPVLRKLKRRGVQVVINTRHPDEHDEPFASQAKAAITELMDLGARVLYTGGHHRKLAIIDKELVWEGSLNILSYSDSCEIMRRIASPEMAEELIRFLRLNKYLGKVPDERF